MLALPSVLRNYEPYVRYFVVTPRKHGPRRMSIDIVVTVSYTMPHSMVTRMRKEIYRVFAEQDIEAIADDIGVEYDQNNPPFIFVDVKLANVRVE